MRSPKANQGGAGADCRLPETVPLDSSTLAEVSDGSESTTRSALLSDITPLHVANLRWCHRLRQRRSVWVPNTWKRQTVGVPVALVCRVGDTTNVWQATKHGTALPGSGAEALCPRSTWNGDEMTWHSGERRATDDWQTALTNGRR